MKHLLFKFFALSACLFSLALSAEEEVRDQSTGVAFPSEVNFQRNGKDFHLKATGVATRKKFFVKVYSVAHYLQNGANTSGGDIFQEILQDNKAKQLTLKWVHEASVEKVQEGYRESFKNAVDSPNSQLQNAINTYLSFFNQEVKVGDEHILRWFPGGDVEVIINGNKAGNINNADFAKALWSIWFGSKSVVDRNRLVSLVK